MSRHSKNCTSNPIFTYAERRRLKYGTISQRLGHDSMKEYDCCGLCMNILIDPLCCPKGHLFCKECIYEFLLAQKKEMSKQSELYEAQLQRVQDEEVKKDVLKKQKEIELFDKTVLGLGKVSAPKQEEPKSIIPMGHVPIKTPMGTYYYPDPSAKESAQKEALLLEAAAEKPEKPSLPFWILGTTKEVTPTLVKKPSSEIKCPDGDHPVRVKQLIKVNFTENKSEGKKEGSYQCCLCCKTLGNAVKTILLKKCGHVMCTTCLSQIKKDGICSICSEKFKEDHIIPILSATSYAGSSGEKGVAKILTPTAWI